MVDGDAPLVRVFSEVAVDESRKRCRRPPRYSVTEMVLCPLALATVAEILV